MHKRKWVNERYKTVHMCCYRSILSLRHYSMIRHHFSPWVRAFQGIVCGSSRWASRCSLLSISFGAFISFILSASTDIWQFHVFIIGQFAFTQFVQCPWLRGSSAIHSTNLKSSAIKLQCSGQNNWEMHYYTCFSLIIAIDTLNTSFLLFTLFFLLVLSNDLRILEYYSPKWLASSQPCAMDARIVSTMKPLLE